mmetsp:Transcript_79210/g.164398  ORF Transcript_79210/g.164398 Transcript_79210/m.164398 type:complete len:103 (+) Transcript_79210:2143-2451(+)
MKGGGAPPGAGAPPPSDPNGTNPGAPAAGGRAAPPPSELSGIIFFTYWGVGCRAERQRGSDNNTKLGPTTPKEEEMRRVAEGKLLKGAISRREGRQAGKRGG